MPQQYKLFIIYAREDAQYLEELRGQLRPLEHAGRIRVWNDREINPGVDWEKEIVHNLDTADIILILVSAAYYNSAYIHEKEINRAISRHERGEEKVLPIIVRPCSFGDDPVISRLQVLPTDGKPVTYWRSRDDAWNNVVVGIMQILNELDDAKIRDEQIAVESALAHEARRREERETRQAAAAHEEQARREQEAAKIKRAAQEEAYRHDERQSYDGSVPATEAEWEKAEIPVSIQNLQNKGNEELTKCSIYAPESLKPDAESVIQVWLHTKKKQHWVAKIAQYFFPDSSLRQSKYLEIKLNLGDQVIVELISRTVVVENPIQKIVWHGEPESVDFQVRVPPNATGPFYFTARIRLQDMPLGDFKFQISADLKEKNAATVLSGVPIKFSKAFVSYSSIDRSEVLKRTQMLSALQFCFFQDVLDLNLGEDWSERLESEIESCDLFLLFWSSNSKNSDWVRKEIQYALQRKGGIEDNPPTIIPVPIEGPPLPTPPEELKHLQFNDRILYMIQ